MHNNFFEIEIGRLTERVIDCVHCTSKGLHDCGQNRSFSFFDNRVESLTY